MRIAVLAASSYAHPDSCPTSERETDLESGPRLAEPDAASSCTRSRRARFGGTRESLLDAGPGPVDELLFTSRAT